MKKTLFMLLALLAVMSLVLAACGPTPEPTQAPEPTKAEEPKPTKAAEPEPTKAEEPAEQVTISIWHQWSGDYLKAIEQAFKDYEAEHPGVTIDLSKPEDTANALSVAIP
ncbi:MAG TPA: ABC transporter substrate-binding protein, partial [Anaerolineae bacterium]|nr:ABC transporter substrate-binding protein [Anaerolineae bacterium]